jgi:hypothetical protein
MAMTDNRLLGLSAAQIDALVEEAYTGELPYGVVRAHGTMAWLVTSSAAEPRYYEGDVAIKDGAGQIVGVVLKP